MVFFIDAFLTSVTENTNKFVIIAITHETNQV